MIKLLPFLRLPAPALFAIFLCTCSISFSARAFQADTSAYQTQRLKVNSLLTERSNKFGQYDQSLDQRTGIFGFQTKQDIKNSNEILRQIVLNDNNIFKELKILMDYKDQEVQQAQRNASSTNSRIQSYMLSIKKLQDQNELLKKEAENLSGGKALLITITALSLIALLGTVYFFRKKLKTARQF
jgi:hypothetical protein